MTDFMFMAIINGGADLPEYSPGLGFLQNFSLVEEIVELAPRCVFHNQHHFLPIFEYLVNMNDIGVAHRAHDLYFPANPH